MRSGHTGCNQNRKTVSEADRILFQSICTAAVTKKQYGSVIYTFYKTKFEYKDENKDAVLKEIKYEEISKIILKRNIFDRIFKISALFCLILSAESLEL